MHQLLEQTHWYNFFSFSCPQIKINVKHHMTLQCNVLILSIPQTYSNSMCSNSIDTNRNMAWWKLLKVTPNEFLGKRNLGLTSNLYKRVIQILVQETGVLLNRCLKCGSSFGTRKWAEAVIILRSIMKSKSHEQTIEVHMLKCCW